MSLRKAIQCGHERNSDHTHHECVWPSDQWYKYTASEVMLARPLRFRRILPVKVDQTAVDQAKEDSRR